MSANKILFATDFSECSEAACKAATVLARDAGASLEIVHVHEPPQPFVDTGFGGYPVPADEDEAELLEELKKVVPSDPQVPCHHHLLTGEPATAIVQFAQQQNVNMIVVGTHGRTGLSRLLMGSVAEAVVRNATCPVLTYRQPQGKEVESD